MRCRRKASRVTLSCSFPTVPALHRALASCGRRAPFPFPPPPPERGACKSMLVRNTLFRWSALRRPLRLVAAKMVARVALPASPGCSLPFLSPPPFWIPWAEIGPGQSATRVGTPHLKYMYIYIYPCLRGWGRREGRGQLGFPSFRYQAGA